MKNEDFKIITERWDKYVKESEPLDEIDPKTLKKAAKVTAYGAGAAAAGYTGLAVLGAYAGEIVTFLSGLISSGKIAYWNSMISLIFQILTAAGWFSAKAAGGYLMLRTAYRYISKAKNQQSVFQGVHNYFDDLESQNPDKKGNIQAAHTLVIDSYKQISESTLRLVDAKVIQRELEQETGDKIEGILEKLSEFVLAKFKLAGDKLAGGINVFIAGNYADPELRKTLTAVILSDVNAGKYLKTKSNYDPKTGALRFEPTATPAEPEPEPGGTTPSGLSVPSGDYLNKFG